MYKVLSPGHLGHNVDLETTALFAEKYGYDAVSIDIMRDITLPAKTVLSLLSKYHVTATHTGLPVNFTQEQDFYEKQLIELENYAKFAKECGAASFNTWLIPGSDDYPYEENFEFHKNRLKPIAEILKKYELRLGLEFVGTPGARTSFKYEFIHNVDGVLDLCRAIGTGNVGILMDSFHWEMAGHTLKDFAKIPDASWITLVHINDAIVGLSREEQNDVARALPGSTGVIPIKDFFQGLLNLGYCGPVECEPFVPALGDMEFEKAVVLVKEAIDSVWL